MLHVDGSAVSGSGMIVRDAMAYAATTGTAIRVFNARARRPQPGLRPQHLCAVEAVHHLVGGVVEGARVGSREFTFEPGQALPRATYRFDVGTQGPPRRCPWRCFRSRPRAQIGWSSSSWAGCSRTEPPPPFHLQHVLAPLLGRMGLDVSVTLVRPGYVPAGGGEIRLRTTRMGALSPLLAERQERLLRIWGIALASHLAQRRVAARMARAA